MMAIWSITRLMAKPLEDDLPNVVVHVGWKAVHDTAEKSGSVTLSAPKENFIFFEELTKNDVLRWVWAIVDKQAIESDLNAQLAPVAANPATVLLPLPWA